MESKKEKSESEIKKELIYNDLSKLLGALIIIFLVAGACGYIGYVYSKDNNLSISHGIIFGILFPLGVGLLELFDCNNFFGFLLYTIVYILIAGILPTFVGGIILFLIIGIFIIDFVYIKKKDRTEEINNIIEKNKIASNKNYNYNTNTYIPPFATEEIEDSDNKDIYTKEEFECEMCFKKISEEEYELYDCMCEDCFMDIHIDNDGNYHDEELL